MNEDPSKIDKPEVVAIAAPPFGILSRSLCVFVGIPVVLNDLYAVAVDPS